MRGERGKRGSRERRRDMSGQFVRKGGRTKARRDGERRKREERKGMETNIDLPSQDHVGVKRFLKGELVEVRQREKGLRGSWHPAIVIGVKTGRRVVEYDELLTDDGQDKLTESITVGRCLEGGKLAAARPSWKSPAKRTLALLRPRPPPLPDPFSISWSKGLSVDCYFKDAWWEGVLTEAISSPGRQKGVLVWFPEEEDLEVMPLKDMRVGQQWDEDTGAWSLKGCVDVPVSRRRNRVRTMSLGRESRGFIRRSKDSMELAIALRIDETRTRGREAEYTSAWNNIDRTLDDSNAVISVQLNSPSSTSLTPGQVPLANGAGTDRPEDDLKNLNPAPLAYRTRISDWSPPRLRSSPRGRSVEESSCAITSSGEAKDNADVASNKQLAAKDNVDKWGLVVREPSPGSEAMMDEDNLVLDEPALSLELGRRDAERGNRVKGSWQEAGRAETAMVLVRDPDEDRQRLIDSGWNVSQNLRKNGKPQWYYRSPNGCLLGSLASAIGMLKQMNEDNKDSSEDENPTLSDMKLAKSGRGSAFSKGRPGKARISKGSRRVASPIPVRKDEGQGMDHLELSPAGPNSWDMICTSGPPVGSNGTMALTITDDTSFSPKSNLNCKRNASESELTVDDIGLNELKRRKVQGSSGEQSQPSVFQPILSNGGPIEGSMYLAAVPPVQTSATIVTNSLVEFEKSLDDGHPSGGGRTLETRSKKRACLTDGFKCEPTNELLTARSVEGRSPIGDGPIEHEPRSKKSRYIANEVNSPPEGKSRKSLAILQESSRKKGHTPFKGGELKQTKKGVTKVKKSASHVKKGKKSRTPGRAGVRLEVLLSAPGSTRDPTLGEGEFAKKRTLLSWLIDNGKVVEHEKVRYLHRKDLHCMLEGHVTRDGILCRCCKKIVTLSVFEAHAGSKLHRPSANIFLDDGRSLSACQVEALALKTQNESDSQSGVAEHDTVDKSDDTCGICGDGGELICCDHCPSTFHLSCMGLQEVPDGDWYCPNCRCASCGGSQFNGDQATFNDLTVILCDQCECEYHVKCLRARGLELNAPPDDHFFCGDSCGRIYHGLRSLVGICKPMEGGFSWTLLRSGADDDRKAGRVSNTEINAEHDSKLSIALSVMQECFRPMIDPRTKIDIITNVLYNRRSEVSRLNYHGFYTMLLERGDELISVATIRVHGARLAEMPLIGTRFQYRRQGMCRRLMSAIEEMLQSLGVERLVLPAVPELLDTWTGAFGFQPMDESQRLNQLMDLNIMAFPGTSILYKSLDMMEPRPAVNQPSFTEIVEPGLQKKHSHPSLASPPVIVKRGRGRPPKVKGEIVYWNGLALTARVGPCKVANSDHDAKHSESPVAWQPVTVKRGRGRPPRINEAHFKSSDRVTLAASVAVVGAHELAEAGRDAGHKCSSTSQGGEGKGPMGLTRPLNNGDHQLEIEPSPNVLRRKRGRPPRARVNYNSSTGILSTTTTSIRVDQVARFQGGRMQISSAARDQSMVDREYTRSQRSSETRFPSTEEKGLDEMDTLTVFRKTTRSMREVRTPLWLVESENDETRPVSRSTPMRERSCKTLALEGRCQNDIPPLESSTTGSTKTYERRKTKFSPSSERESNSRMEGDESDSEPTYGPSDFFNEDGLELEAEPGFKYEEVSVPIRTFPSQFSSRSDQNVPPGTFIPVETIVVNSQPKAEPMDEFFVNKSEEKLVESSHLEEEEQTNGGKLLLRLKLSKKKDSPLAACAVETLGDVETPCELEISCDVETPGDVETPCDVETPGDVETPCDGETPCDVETPQPSPSSIELPNGELLPAAFTVSNQISNEVNQFEQFDQGQVKQPDSSMGPHFIPVTVS